MKELLILLAHLLTTIAKLLVPGGARAVIEVSLLMKHSSSSSIARGDARLIFQRLIGFCSASARCFSIHTGSSELPSLFGHRRY